MGITTNQVFLYGSFKEWLENEGTGQERMLTMTDALEEARKRRQVTEAMEPGGLLSSEVCSAFLPEPQEELPQQFSHQDHLISQDGA